MLITIMTGTDDSLVKIGGIDFTVCEHLTVITADLTS
jgi:hypothetical protein